MSDTKILDAPIRDESNKPFVLFKISGIIILFGFLFGGISNAINSFISELYFETFIGKVEYMDTFTLAILQGIFEGLAYSFIFSIVYTVAFAVITKIKGDWFFAKSQIKKVILPIFGCWILGGIIAIFLAFTFWDFYQNAIFGVPESGWPRVGYAWVGGSIVGAIIGSIVCLIYLIVITYQNWNKYQIV